MRDGPDELADMAIIRVVEYSVDNPLPRAPRFARFAGLVVGDVVEKGWRTVAGGVHSQVQAALPFEKTDFVRRADPGLLEEGGEENGAVNAVHVVEVELDSLGGVLGSAREVHYWHVSHGCHIRF